MSGGDMKYGRDQTQWDELVLEGRRFLEERARLRDLTTYTEMNTVLVRRTGQQGFDFGRQDERAAMGYLLGLIVEDTLAQTGVMLSALVKYLDKNDAGTGFYQLAKEKGLLPRNANRQQRTDFWVAQVAGVYEAYAPPPKRARGGP